MTFQKILSLILAPADLREIRRDLPIFQRNHLDLRLDELYEFHAEWMSAGCLFEDFVYQVARRRCRECGCTDDDCSGCIERTGGPCSWVEDDLCSACI